MDSLLQKRPSPKNKFEIKTTEEYHKQIQKECEEFVLHNVDVTTVDKVLMNLDVAKSSAIDEMSVNFFKDSAPVIVIHR